MTVELPDAPAGEKSGPSWSYGMPTPNLNKALSQLQGKMTRVKKTKEGEIKGVDKYGNPFSYTYQYADLGDVVADLGPFMAEFGLGFTGFPTFDPANRALMVLQYALVHESGEERAGEWPLGPASQKAQALGSAITYARRYSFQAVTNIVLEDDDDGKHATDSHAETWDSAKPRGQGNGQQREQRQQPNNQGPKVDKVAQGLVKAALLIGTNPNKTLDDLVGIEKQIAGRDKLDALVENAFGDGLAKARDILREVRKRMGGEPGDGQGREPGHGGSEEDAGAGHGTPASDPDDGQARAAEREMQFMREFTAELADIHDPDLIGPKRAEIGPAVRDRIISSEIAGDLTALCATRRRELEQAMAGAR